MQVIIFLLKTWRVCARGHKMFKVFAFELLGAKFIYVSSFYDFWNSFVSIRWLGSSKRSNMRSIRLIDANAFSFCHAVCTPI